MRLLACSLLLAAMDLAGQVRVDVRPEHEKYLVGEPVYAVVEVTNIGTEAVGYSECDSSVKLTVRDGKRKTVSHLGGCFVGVGSVGGFGCGIDHPPMLSPGKTTSFRYLLRGFRLEPGRYELRVSGKAGVRWKYYTQPAPHRETDPVEGQMFDLTVKLSVEPGDEESLRAAYKPYVENMTYESKEAIIEMAPPFLETTIADFVRKSADASAVAALGEMNTYASRLDLRDLFASATDSGLRASIVQALAATGEHDNLDFFATILRNGEPGTAGDYAAYGIAYIFAHIGGDDAFEALRTAPARDAVMRALGNTRSARAVPLLISGLTADNRNAVCGALITLTHHQWCDAPPATWASWWRAHESTATIYGPDQCPNMASPLAPLQ